MTKLLWPRCGRVLSIDKMDQGQVQGGFVNDETALAQVQEGFCQLTKWAQGKFWEALSMTKLFWARCRRVLSIDKMGSGQVQGGVVNDKTALGQV